MKFLHTSDWHLGAKLGNYSRLDEQREVLAEMRRISEDEAVDFVLIAGDIFDTFNPPNEAVELLYRELKLFACDGRRPVIAIAGNHDSPDRIEAPDPLAAECGIFFIGYPDYTRGPTELAGGGRLEFPEKGILKLQLPDKPPVRIITTPYANEYRLREYLGAADREEKLSELLAAGWRDLAGRWCCPDGVNLLVAHLFMTAGGAVQGDAPAEYIPFDNTELLKEPEEEKSILHPGGLEMIEKRRIPDGVQYAALGHLHRPAVLGGDPGITAVYSGSPLAFGLSEEDQRKSVCIVEVEPGGVPVVRQVPLESGRRIYRKRFGSADEAVFWLISNPGCYVEILLECEHYLGGQDRGRIMGAHDGITSIIPVPRTEKEGEVNGESKDLPDLSASLEELFCSYFESSRGIRPDSEILEIFREITAETGEADDS